MTYSNSWWCNYLGVTNHNGSFMVWSYRSRRWAWSRCQFRKRSKLVLKHCKIWPWLNRKVLKNKLSLSHFEIPRNCLTRIWKICWGNINNNQLFHKLLQLIEQWRMLLCGSKEVWDHPKDYQALERFFQILDSRLEKTSFSHKAYGNVII